MTVKKTSQKGVSVIKSEVSHSDREREWWIRLEIKNNASEPRTVGLVEEFPNGYDPSPIPLKATDADEVEHTKYDDGRELRLTVNLDAEEEFVIEYSPAQDHTSYLFRAVATQPPQIAGVLSEPSLGQNDLSLDRDTRTADGPSSKTWHDSDEHQHLVDSAPEVDFSDVAGFAEVKHELRTEIIEPFTDSRYDEYDIGKANGIFLFGPPGTGKTFIATALAGELDYNFITVDTAWIRGKKLGSTLKNIRTLFETARANQPCIVFIDEIDSLAPERDGDLHQARAEAVNELLHYVAEINAQNTDVIVIAATNRPNQVDDALKRTGRFDTRIKIGMPDDVTRIGILVQELQRFDGEVDTLWDDKEFLDEFVEATTNFAASDIVEVAEAAQRASIRQTPPGEEPRVTTGLIMEQVSDVGEKQESDTAGEFLTETPDISFSDVGGMDDLKRRLEEMVVEPLENPDLFEEYGLDAANGVLLYGPPGTGKTYISRALAGEIGCSFLEITASDVVSKWVGEAAQNIDELFEKAREIEPAIVFIDEIDAIAGTRTEEQMTTSEEQAVTELLNQLSSLDDANVFVIGATNRPDMLDEALTRSGRLGERIEVPPPDGTARVEILKKQLSGRPVNQDAIEWEELDWLTETGPHAAPYTAADLAKIADEAARYAMDDATPSDIQPISQQHIEQAITETEPTLETPDN